MFLAAMHPHKQLDHDSTEAAGSQSPFFCVRCAAAPAVNGTEGEKAVGGLSSTGGAARESRLTVQPTKVGLPPILDPEPAARISRSRGVRGQGAAVDAQQLEGVHRVLKIPHGWFNRL